ncbi:hypothetical protein ACA081_00055 [Candidatus Hodgkinia cicadicola]
MNHGHILVNNIKVWMFGYIFRVIPSCQLFKTN